MSVSKEDRKAHEDGTKEADYIRDHPIGYTFTGGVRSRPSDPSKAEAYDKGIRREQLDEDKESGSSGGCFLTTACVEYAGLPDNCHELDTMRELRENYICNLPEGNNFLREYAEVAPHIVRRIKDSHNRDVILETLLTKCRSVVALIERKLYAEAYSHCKAEFEALKKKYL